MPKTLTTVTELSRRFSDYMNRVKYRRESFILTKGKEPFAEIRPLPRGLTGPEFLDLIKNGPHLDPDDIEQFAKDIDDARREMDSLPIRDPWED
jgi:hypothetical protein